MNATGFFFQFSLSCYNKSPLSFDADTIICVVDGIKVTFLTNTLCSSFLVLYFSTLSEHNLSFSSLLAERMMAAATAASQATSMEEMKSKTAMQRL